MHVCFQENGGKGVRSLNDTDSESWKEKATKHTAAPTPHFSNGATLSSKEKAVENFMMS